MGRMQHTFLTVFVLFLLSLFCLTTLQKTSLDITKHVSFTEKQIIGGFNKVDLGHPAIYYDMNVFRVKKASTDIYPSVNDKAVNQFQNIVYITVQNGPTEINILQIGRDGLLDKATKLINGFFAITDFFVRHNPATNDVEFYVITGNSIVWIVGDKKEVICGRENGGFSGDGGLAIDGLLNDPAQIHVHNGEVFILDGGNLRIRKILQNGTLITFAGGGNLDYQNERVNVATEIRLFPYCFTVTKQGHVILVDKSNGVMEILPSGRIQRLFMITGQQFTSVQVSVSNSGVIQDIFYLSSLSRILKCDSLGNCNTIARAMLENEKPSNSTSNGKPAISAPLLSIDSLFLDIDGETVYFMSELTIIRKIDPRGILWTVYGSISGTIEYLTRPPFYITDNVKQLLSSEGSVYFSSMDNIRKLGPDGTVSIVLTLSDEFLQSSPHNCNVGRRAYDVFMGVHRSIDSFYMASDMIYFSSVAHGIFTMDSRKTICQIAGWSVPDGGLAIKAVLGEPQGLFLFKSDLYFADTKLNIIRKISNDHTIETVAGIPNNFGYDGDGGQALAAKLDSPTGVHVHENIIYIADTNNNVIRKISINGIIETVAGNNQMGNSGDGGLAIHASLNRPTSVFVTRNGQLLIADTGNHLIRKVDTMGIIHTIAGVGIPGFLDSPNPLEILLNKPTSIKVVEDKLFFADIANHIIRKIDLTRNVSSIAAGIGNNEGNAPDSLFFPHDLCVNFRIGLVADTLNNRILGFNGISFDLFMVGVDKPKSIQCLQDGSFYFTEKSSIMKFSAREGVKKISGTVGDGGSALYSKFSVGQLITFGNLLYIADPENNRIRIIDSNGIISTGVGNDNTGFSGDGLKGSVATLSNPKGVYVTKQGDIFIADSNNHRIRMISPKSKDSISTIAGTGFPIFIGGADTGISATQSRVTAPEQIFVNEKSGEVYFLSTFLYKISKRDGTILKIDVNMTSLTSFNVIPETGQIISANKAATELTPICDKGYILNLDSSYCLPVCFGIPYQSDLQCSSSGICVSPNTCECNAGYNGTMCENPICSKTCSNNGICKSPEVCDCIEGFSGIDCSISTSSKNWIIGIIVGGLIAIGIIIAIIISVIAHSYYTKHKRRKFILQADTSLDSRLLSGYDEEMQPTITKSQEYSTFFIPLHQLKMDKTISRLGEGGQGSVFKTYWNNTLVAVKVFDMNNMNISEEDFTIEASLLGRLRHPNIINFFGVSVSPTKRFIVMECLDSNLDAIIAKLQCGSLELGIAEKLRILLDISKGIEYLHTQEPIIIHRDLKPANILLDSQQVCKLCDFGLSRTLSKNTFSALTVQIGTCYYMAPELVSSGENDIDRGDATSIDIYSLSIIMYQVLFELTDPYSRTEVQAQKLGRNSPKQFNNMYQLHHAICNDNYRPIVPFSNIEECKEWTMKYRRENKNDCQVLFELTTLIQKCWERNPHDRPNIETVVNTLSNFNF